MIIKLLGSHGPHQRKHNRCLFTREGIAPRHAEAVLTPDTAKRRDQLDKPVDVMSPGIAGETCHMDAKAFLPR